MEYGETPPLLVVVKVTGAFTSGAIDETVKLVDSGGGGVVVPKNSVMGVALQSVETMHARPQFFSSVASNE